MTTESDNKETDSLHGPNLILDVENFGPIAEAKNIEFKPMTVFVGPSNTGKTYLATLLHAYLQANDSHSRDGMRRSRPRVGPTLGPTNDSYETLRLDLLRVLDTRKFPAIGIDNFIFNASFSELSSASAELFRTSVVDHLDVSQTDTLHAIADYFELHPLEDYAAHSSTYNDSTSISIRGDGFYMNLDNNTKPKAFFEDDPSVSMSDRDVEHLRIRDNSVSTDLTTHVIHLLRRIVAGFVDDFFDCLPRSFYFPTGRTGILNTHRVLTSQIVKNAFRFGIEVHGGVNYHRLAGEFLALLIGLGDPSHHASTGSRAIMLDVRYHRARRNAFNLADVLENALVGGEIKVSVPEIGLPNFEYARNGVLTPIFRASSMVSELAPIVMFLRSYIRPSDLLIIDEPEAHLHPEAQQQMAAALAFMVRSGLRVLITTHSHYMVEQLSAFVNASKLDEDTRKRALSLGGSLGHEDIYLNEDETAVYNFRLSPEHRGSVVEEVFMGDEFEYGTDDHSDAVTDQFNRLQRVLEAREKVESGELD